MLKFNAEIKVVLILLNLKAGPILGRKRDSEKLVSQMPQNCVFLKYFR